MAEATDSKGVWKWVFGITVGFILFVAFLWVLMGVRTRESEDKLLLVITDVRNDLEKQIKNLAKKFASEKDLRALEARVAVLEKEKHAHTKQGRRSSVGHGNKSDNKSDKLAQAMGQGMPLSSPAPQFPDPALCDGRWVRAGGDAYNCETVSRQTEHREGDNAVGIAAACAPQGIVPDGYGGWRCAEEVQSTLSQGGAAYSPQSSQQFYGANDTRGGYDVPWLGMAIGCVAGGAATAGAVLPACAKVAAGTLIGDGVGYVAGGVVADGRYRDDFRLGGKLVGGGLALDSVITATPVAVSIPALVGRPRLGAP